MCARSILQNVAAFFLEFVRWILIIGLTLIGLGFTSLVFTALMGRGDFQTAVTVLQRPWVFAFTVFLLVILALFQAWKKFRFQNRLV